MSKFPVLTEAIANSALALGAPSDAYPEMCIRSIGAFGYSSQINLELDRNGLLRWATYLRTDNLDSVRDAEDNLFVPASRYMDATAAHDSVNKRRLDGIAFIRELFDADGKLRDRVDLSLEEANRLLSILGGEDMTHTREFDFSFTVSYVVSGSITATDEEAARQYIEALTETLTDPDYQEPSLDEPDEEWGFISVDYNDTEELEIW